MESLNDTSWDVVIAGTGLPQSLLALALSRSGNNVLHVDRNDYYGGEEAALNLTDAEAWAQSHAGDTTLSFRHATVGKPDTTETSPKLAQSRAYSLALAPHLLYSRCSLLSTLVSSQSHSQLEFQAVGSWFVVETPTEQSDLDSQTRLTRVPGGREDVFQDGTLNLKAKRSLMKFLRFVIGYEEQTEVWEADRSQILSVFLEQKFSLPPSSHAPILALSMSAQSSQSTTVEYALPRISRHLKSIGVFGPGFPAVLPKWGGLAEISQVACRAGAVGGGVYVLGKGVTKVQSGSESKLEIHLDDAEKVSSQWLVGTSLELPSVTRANPSNQIITSRTISVISSPLKLLFPATSEGGVTPAGAVIITPGNGDSEPPVYIFAHSSDSGECPSGQTVLYASIALNRDTGFSRLQNAIAQLLKSVCEQPPPQVLWSLEFEHVWSPPAQPESDSTIALQSLPNDLVLEESVLEDVKAAWQRITGADASTFMCFAAREGTMDDDEDT